MKKSFYFYCIFLIFISSYVHADKPELKTWDVFEVDLIGQKTLNNPYIDGLAENNPAYVIAKFTGSTGKAKGLSYTIPGFWDGNNNWKIRFAPPYEGTWDYITISPDAGLNNKKGTIEVVDWTEKDKKENPTRRGFVQVVTDGERKGRYFVYSDRTPFLWVGDTWWNWIKKDVKFESFKKLVDTRSIQGFTIGQIFFAGNGRSGKSSLLDESYTIPNIENIKKVEKMIQYANKNGITVWIHPWWTRESINESIGPEVFRRWWRYVIHRLHAYNVIWVIAGEYNMNNYGGFGLEFWKNIGRLIKSEDPYDRIVSAHPTPPGWEGGADAPQWSTAEILHDEEWLDYNQSQVGHGRWRNEYIPQIIEYGYKQEPPKPIVVTEPWYEFVEGNPTAMDVRFGAWSAFLSGAAGHSYGGGHVWRAHLPESPEGAGIWPLDIDFNQNTMLYEGARSISFFSHFLKKLEWWKFEPRPELVLENPSRYCGAIPGKSYLLYLRYGGTVKLDLRKVPKKSFQYEWIDLTTGVMVKSGELLGGSVVLISPPEEFPIALYFKDWLLLVRCE